MAFADLEPQRREAVNLQAFVPLVTYPEPKAEAIAGRAASLAAGIDGA